MAAVTDLRHGRRGHVFGVIERERADECGLRAELGERVERENATTEAIGAHRESGPAAGKRILARQPWPIGRCVGAIRIGVIAVVEHDLECPAHLRWKRSFEHRGVDGEGSAVAVGDALQVALRERGRARLERRRRVDAVEVLGFVFEPYDVTVRMDLQLRKPNERSRFIVRIGDARSGVRPGAKDREDVAAVPHAKVHASRRTLDPFFDAQLRRAEPAAVKGDRVPGIGRDAALLPATAVLRQRRHERVAVDLKTVVAVPPRRTLACVDAEDGQTREHPSGTDLGVPGARRIDESQVRRESAAAGRRRNGDAKRADAGEGIDVDRVRQRKILDLPSAKSERHIRLSQERSTTAADARCGQLSRRSSEYPIMRLRHWLFSKVALREGVREHRRRDDVVGVAPVVPLVV